jgi:hypothetical protein
MTPVVMRARPNALARPQRWCQASGQTLRSKILSRPLTDVTPWLMTVRGSWRGVAALSACSSGLSPYRRCRTSARRGTELRPEACTGGERLFDRGALRVERAPSRTAGGRSAGEGHSVGLQTVPVRGKGRAREAGARPRAETFLGTKARARSERLSERRRAETPTSGQAPARAACGATEVQAVRPQAGSEGLRRRIGGTAATSRAARWWRRARRRASARAEKDRTCEHS